MRSALTDVSVHPDAVSSHRAAAEAVADHVRRSARRSGNPPALAVSMRERHTSFLDRLAAVSMPWADLVLGQVDELVDVDPRDSDWSLVEEHLVSERIELEAHCLPLPLTGGEVDSDSLYRHDLRLRSCLGVPFRYDVVQLSLSADGAIGPLETGDPILDSTKSIDVSHGSPRRIGMTFAAMQRALHVVVLASGEESAAAVARLVAREGAVPASMLRHSQIEVFTDEAAASFLTLAD